MAHEQARRSLCHGLIAAMEKRTLEVPVRMCVFSTLAN